MKTIVFIYNADSGSMNLLADMAHKALSPSTYKCQLCLITYGVFSIKKKWQIFLQSLEVESKFYHKNELEGPLLKYADELPAVIITDDEKEIFSLKGTDFENILELDDLISKINHALQI